MRNDLTFAKKVGIPLGVLALVSFGLSTWNSHFTILGVAFALLGVGVYMLHEPLNLWWAKRNPPLLPTEAEAVIGQFSSFYRDLTLGEKERFRSRVGVWLLAKNYVAPKPLSDVPEDIKVIIATWVIQMTFHIKDNYYLKSFENIVVYRHAFPSPKLRYIHSCEVDYEDNVVIFDIERMMLGITQKEGFNTLCYCFGEVFFEVFQDKKFKLSWSDELREKIPAIRGYDYNYIVQYIGTPPTELIKKGEKPFVPSVYGVFSEFFFMRPSKLKEELPSVYSEMAAAYNLRKQLSDIHI